MAISSTLSHTAFPVLIKYTLLNPEAVPLLSAVMSSLASQQYPVIAYEFMLALTAENAWQKINWSWVIDSLGNLAGAQMSAILAEICADMRPRPPSIWFMLLDCLWAFFEESA